MKHIVNKIAISALLAFAVAASASTTSSNDAGKNSLARPASATAITGTLFNFSGSLTGTTATQTDRVFRDGNPSTCGSPKTYPGNYGSGTYRHVVSTPFTNSTGGAICATVTLTTDATCAGDVFATAYSGSFDVNNLGTNYLADSGSSIGGASQSESFQVLVPANGTVVFNINEATNGGTAVCGFSLAASIPTPAPALNLRNLALFGLGLLALGLIAIRRRVAK